MNDRWLEPGVRSRTDGSAASLRFQRRIRELRAEREGFASGAQPFLYNESGFPLRRGPEGGGLAARVRRLLARE